VDAVTTQPVDGLAELPLSDDRRAALRDVLGAYFSSRALVWVAGILAVLAVGFFPGGSGALDPHHLTAPFHQRLLNILISPATRWDSAWYLSIARTGYVFPFQTVFFPLYPGLIALGGAFLGHGLDAVVGIVVSCGCAIGALYLLHRLVSLEFDQRLAHNTVWIFAWLPTALALSAVYSEALFLLLAVGSFYAGRTGRWALAGMAGGLAAMTRNGGILLLLPLLVLYLYGPRTDREPDRIAAGLSPRYRLRRDASWIALVPLGLLAYVTYLAFATGQPFAPFIHQSHWGRHFFPLGALLFGVWGAFKEIAAAIPGLDPHLGRHMTFGGVTRHLYDFAFLVFSLFLLRLCWKRLPAAYTVFAAASLAMAVSVPATDEPLKSFPRFTLVMFPLWIALALWATERRLVRTIVAVSAPLLALYAYLFVSWSWTP
jgi:hypothetical protein